MIVYNLSIKIIMEQIELFDIDNPCISICETNLLGYCKGCFRNRLERLNWNHINNIQKSQILQKCKSRKYITLHKNRSIETNQPINEQFNNNQLSLF